MAPHSSTLAWKIPRTEEPGRLQSMGSLGLDTTERLHFYFSLSCIGEGNGNPLQCSCLENPRDGRAWWAAVYGVAQSRTRLKQLSSSSLLSTFCHILYHEYKDIITSSHSHNLIKTKFKSTKCKLTGHSVLWLWMVDHYKIWPQRSWNLASWPNNLCSCQRRIGKLS